MFNGLLIFSFKEVAIGILLSVLLIGGGLAAIVAFVPRSAGGEVAPPTSPTPPSEVVTPTEPADMVTTPSDIPMTSVVHIHSGELAHLGIDYGGTVKIEDVCPTSPRVCYGAVGREVTVTAIPNDGFAFSRWGCTGISCPLDLQSNPIKMKLDDNVQLRTFWNEEYHSGLDLDNSSEGGHAVRYCGFNCMLPVTTGSSGNQNYPVYFMLPIPDERYKFDKWECRNLSFPNYECVTPEQGIVVDQNPLEITAFWYPQEYELSDIWKLYATGNDTSTINIGLVSLKPLFVPSAETPTFNGLEINLPGEFNVTPKEFNYAVLNQTSKTSSHYTDLYESIAEYSVNQWSSINPEIKFRHVTPDNPDLNLQIAYLNDDVLNADGNRGVYCEYGCYELGDIPTAAIRGGTSLSLENYNFCTQNNHAIGLLEDVTFVTMHELGHALGLAHHFSHLNLLSGNLYTELPFDNLGLNIPKIRGVDILDNKGGVPSGLEYNTTAIEKYQENFVELSDRFSYLHFLLSFDRAGEARYSKEREMLQSEYDDLRLKLLCGEPIEVADLNNHDHSHLHSHPHP